jgi:hypothetical protein
VSDEERERALFQAVSKALFVCPFSSPAWPFVAEAKMLVDGFDPVVAAREAHELQVVPARR